ncbi:MAG: alkaline phosphatase D family protein [Candidatus Krumholzibacteria bacterium]|nr:alkaline phosphatase D family protein [Candidatus Krumholzibacteria bacterium]
MKLSLVLLLLPFLAQAAITHGPVVGAVTHESARIVIRTDNSSTFHFELSPVIDDYSLAIVSTEVTTSWSEDYFGIVDVSGLEAGVLYSYRAILDGEATETLGSFRSFPEPGSVPESFSFGFGSGQQNVTDGASNDGRIWAEVDAADLDFFVHLGDWTYPDYAWEVDHGFPPYFHQVPGRVTESYKTRYDPDYPMNEIFDTLPLAYVYDDHDYTHNNSDGSYSEKFNSLQGYLDCFPGYPLPNPEEGVFHSFRYGNAEFFMLDTRTQRDPNSNGFRYHEEWLEDPSVKIRFDPDESHRLLGETQMNWLLDALASSEATWKFLVSTMTWNPGNRAVLELAASFQGDPRFDPVDTPIGSYSAATVAIEASDGGSGFPSVAERLVDGIVENQVENVIFITGDSHTVAIDKGENSLIPEIMAGGLDRTNSMVVAYQEVFGIFTWSGEGQHIWQGNFDEHYGKVTVNGDESVLLEAYDPNGNLIASHTLEEGFLPEKVNLTVSTSGYDFGEVKAGYSASFPISLINTGADPLEILSLSDPGEFFSLRGLDIDMNEEPELSTPFTLLPGEKQVLGFGFEPQEEGAYDTDILIESNDPDGVQLIHLSGTATEADSLPGPLLSRNFPNPFNPETSIHFRIAERGQVRIDLMDVRGRRVDVILDEFREAGAHEIDYRPDALSSGLYLYRIEHRGQVMVRRMMLLQ